jgi:hypothetical protein
MYKIIIIIFILLIFLAYYKYNEIKKKLLPIKMNTKIPINILNNTDKIIWSYWHSENIPLTVHIAYHTWHKNNIDYIICHISDKNLFHYINKKDLPDNFNNKIIQHRADIIRLILLEKYGGIWLDSTIYLNKPLNTKWDPKNYDVGGFVLTKNINLYFENWFISAPKHSKLIKEWKKEFLYASSFKNSDDYINKITKEGINLDIIVYKNYLLQHCCFIKITQNKKYKIKYFSTDEPFKYLHKHNFNSYKTVLDIICNNNEKNIPSIIKLRGIERNILNKLIIFNQNNSILSKII